MTFTHTNKPDYAYEEVYPEWWHWFCKRQVDKYRRFLDVVRENQQIVPTFFMRFEDLIAHPLETQKALFSFLLDVPDLDGTNCERRL